MALYARVPVLAMLFNMDCYDRYVPLGVTTFKVHPKSMYNQTPFSLSVVVRHTIDLKEHIICHTQNVYRLPQFDDGPELAPTDFAMDFVLLDMDNNMDLTTSNLNWRTFDAKSFRRYFHEPISFKMNGSFSLERIGRIQIHLRLLSRLLHKSIHSDLDNSGIYDLKAFPSDSINAEDVGRNLFQDIDKIRRASINIGQCTKQSNHMQETQSTATHATQMTEATQITQIRNQVLDEIRRTVAIDVFYQQHGKQRRYLVDAEAAYVKMPQLSYKDNIFQVQNLADFECAMILTLLMSPCGSVLRILDYITDNLLIQSVSLVPIFQRLWSTDNLTELRNALVRIGKRTIDHVDCIKSLDQQLSDTSKTTTKKRCRAESSETSKSETSESETSESEISESETSESETSESETSGLEEGEVVESSSPSHSGLSLCLSSSD